MTFTSIRKHARRRDVVILLVTAIVLVAASTLFVRSRAWVTVHLVNGLDLPVVVAIGGQNVAVAPHQRSSARVRSGLQLATATADGHPIDSAVIQADPSIDAVVYNVLGAAPLLAATVRYVAVAETSRKPDISLLGGERVVALDNVDYVFTEPPKSISTESHGEVKRRVLMMPEDADAATTLYQLLSNGKKEAAVGLAESIARLQPDSRANLSHLELVSRSAYGDGSTVPALLPLLGRAKQTDDIVSLIRLESCHAGSCERGSKLTAASVAGMTPVKRELFSARDLPRNALAAKLDELSKAYPDDPEVAASRGWLAVNEERWADCVTAYEKAQGRPDAAFDVDDRATCLFALGRRPEAMKLAQSTAERTDDAAFLGSIITRRLARLTNEKLASPTLKVGRDSDRRALEEQRELTYAFNSATIDASSPVPDYQAGAKARELALDGTNGFSVRPWSDASVEVTRILPDPLLVAAGAEMAIRGELGLSRRLLAATNRVHLSPESMIDYVLSGIEPTALYRVGLEERAVLDVIRARRLAQLGNHDDANRLYESARRRDVLKGWPTRLMDHWQKRSLETAPVRVYVAKP